MRNASNNAAFAPEGITFNIYPALESDFFAGYKCLLKTDSRYFVDFTRICFEIYAGNQGRLKKERE